MKCPDFRDCVSFPNCSKIFLQLLFFAGVASARQQPHNLCVPFHSVYGMILLDARVNSKAAVLLLDTGGNRTAAYWKRRNLQHSDFSSQITESAAGRALAAEGY